MAPSKSIFSPAPFDGRRFSNFDEKPSTRSFALVRWLMTRQRGPWPSSVATKPAPKPVDRALDDSIRATVVGHSTVLIQMCGLNVITDPVWSRRIGLWGWLGPARVAPPAFPFDVLPSIDVVLLSHNHYDHLDRPSLRALVARDDPLILTGLRAGRAAPSDNVVELDWWQSRSIDDKTRMTYVPAAHFSARGLFDRNASLWGGFVIESQNGSVYFAGDTGDGPHFAAIRDRFGPMDLSLLPIGAYEPRWMMASVHVDPEEALAASLILQSTVSVGIHYGAFRLADEGFEAPHLALAAAIASMKTAGIRGGDFRTPEFGHPVVVYPSRLRSQIESRDRAGDVH
jgi:L-ascorbate metabolism protein UlaG (beta-lactamase superfamily)